MVLRQETGGGGGAGGTFGAPTTSSTGSSSGLSNDPLSLTGMNQQQLAGGVMGGISASSQALPTDQIFVGTRAMGYGPGRGLGVSLNDTTSYDQAQNLPGAWYSSDKKFYDQFMNKLIMYKFPGASSDMGLPEVGKAWDSLLSTAIQLNKASNGKNNWTPWDVLESYNRPAGSMGTYKSGDWLIDAATGEKVKYVGPKTKTTTQRAVDLSDAEQVQAIATQALTQMIGRAPTDKELARFKATLNGYEKSHPEITTTTDTYDDMGNVSASNVVHSGGVDDAARASMIGEGVKDTKEYGKYQSGTTYFNALMQMVGGG
jgi:hypothetical protein